MKNYNKTNIDNNSEKVAVVILARNEEKFIGKMLSSLLEQDLLPYRILVVNDGSTDKTKEVVSSFDNIELINREKRNGSLVGKKELAEVINLGLEKFQNDKNCDFIFFPGAELLYQKNYLLSIVKRMKNNPKIVISSGVIKGEFSIEPRGAGRVIRYDFWKKLGLAYPINYGYEAYLLLKAESMGYLAISYPDLIIETLRKTGSKYEPKRYYYYGLGLKALGYTLPYVLIRAALFAKKKPKGAFYLLKGFLSSYNDLYDKELRQFVKKTQYHKMTRIDPSYIKRFKGQLRN